MMDRIARVDGTVLLTGESGTGKELVARAIHFAGPAQRRPVRRRQLRGHPARPASSREFFGHSKGAFTDAKSRDDGQVRAGPQGDDLPGRDRRAAARGPGQAPARPGRARDRQGRRDADHPGRRARDRGHQQGPGRGGPAGALPRGPLLPAGRAVAPRCRRCASGGRTSRCSCEHFLEKYGKPSWSKRSRRSRRTSWRR